MKGGADGGLKVGWRRELGQREFCGIDKRSEAFSCPYTPRRNYIIYDASLFPVLMTTLQWIYFIISVFQGGSGSSERTSILSSS